jgi:hypothetical protein
MEIQEADEPQEEIILVHPSGDGVTNDKFETESICDLYSKMNEIIKQERENAKTIASAEKSA